MNTEDRQFNTAYDHKLGIRQLQVCYSCYGCELSDASLALGARTHREHSRLAHTDVPRLVT